MKIKKKTLDRNKTKEILDSFHELVIEKGYNNVSINDIRNKSKIALGTIYKHFPQGKIAIIKQKLIDITREQLKLEKFLTFNNDPDSLKEFISNLVKIQRKDDAFYRGITQALITNPLFFQEIHEISNEYYKKLVKKIKDDPTQYPGLSEEILIKVLKFISETCNAYIQRHMFISPIFDSDEELIGFLTKLIQLFIENEFKIIF